MTYFALKRKNGFVFRCESNTEEKFNKKVESAYSTWKGLQPKESTASFDDFMAYYDRVKVTVEVSTMNNERSEGDRLTS